MRDFGSNLRRPSSIAAVTLVAVGCMSTSGSLQELARTHITVQSQGQGGNTKFLCRHCQLIFTGSLTRQLAHLSGKTGQGIAVCKRIDNESLTTVQRHLQRLERIRTGSHGSHASSSNIVGQTGKSGVFSYCIELLAVRRTLLLQRFACRQRTRTTCQKEAEAAN